MDKKPEAPVLSPYHQPTASPTSKPGVLNIRVEIKIGWPFVRNVLRKWLTSRPFVQNIEFTYVPPKP